MVSLCSDTVGETEWVCYGTQRSWNVWGQEETDRDRAALLSAGKSAGGKNAHLWENHIRCPHAASHPSIFRSSLNKIRTASLQELSCPNCRQACRPLHTLLSTGCKRQKTGTLAFLKHIKRSWKRPWGVSWKPTFVCVSVCVCVCLYTWKLLKMFPILS